MNGTTQTDMDPPAILQMDGFGMAHLVLIVENESCPETHYQCPDGYCIPTYLLNNHEQDCLGGEDEKIPKLSFTCPGYYRCVATGSCLHPDFVCDEFFRAFLWIFSVLAITGNTGVLIYRLFFETEGTSFGHKVLVTNLSLSDFLMGVYLMVIGTADAQFRGLYVSKAGQWKESSTCMTAGVLALVSSEVSAFAICLITLDRLLVIRYPFNSRLRLSTKRNALTICGATWAVGLTLATLPLFQITWEFYGQNGICLPLPITQRPFAGQQYAFGVFVILNFLIFLVIGAGQALILHSICSSAKATMRDDHKREITVARRLFLIVFTDFCCWFPVGLMGLLVLGGVPIPGVVNVLAAVFVLPLNSAVNPFLYTLNTLLERRAKRRMNERIERLMGKLRAELRTWPRDKVEEHVHYCLTARLVPRQRMLQALGVGVDLYSNKDHWPGQPETVVSRTTSATRMME
nr:hypothetical protein BaRGS_004185 [Batillaria attramentaria]